MEQNMVSQHDLSPLEHEVLEEYERLADNMKRVCHGPFPNVNVDVDVDVSGRCRAELTRGKLASRLDELASDSSLEIADGLRELERRTSLAFTLLKTSVYSIVLQQEYEGGGE